MRIKRLTFILLTVLCTAIMAHAKQYTLVIDAGHGGNDHGAVGQFSKEKDINLKVALAFGRYVEKYMPNVKVIYTRKTDVFIPLQQRANIANKNHADIFISIHTNAVPKAKNVYGVETYTMGLRRSNEKFSAALRENEVITYEKDYQEKYNGYDPKLPESIIMFELMHDSNMEESVKLASSIQKSICAEASRQSKGVKQDVFLVLRETSMPACLIELGFISTPEEEQFLNTESGIERLAMGIYKGFANYSRQGNQNVEYIKPVETQKPRSQEAQKSRSTEAQKPAEASKTTEASKPKSSEAQKTAEAPKPKSSEASPIIYKVQILVSDKELKSTDPQLKGHKEAKFYKDGGMYKYTIGETSNKQEAFSIRKQLLDDFPDAFVIITKDGVRQ